MSMITMRKISEKKMLTKQVVPGENRKNDTEMYYKNELVLTLDKFIVNNMYVHNFQRKFIKFITIDLLIFDEHTHIVIMDKNPIKYDKWKIKTSVQLKNILSRIKYRLPIQQMTNELIIDSSTKKG